MGIRDHKEEVIRYLNTPVRPGIWWRECDGTWLLCDDVSWNKNAVYIVDDEWAELRKSIVDGKRLQYYDNVLNKWEPIDLYDLEVINKDPLPDMDVSIYRVKPE